MSPDGPNNKKEKERKEIGDLMKRYNLDNKPVSVLDAAKTRMIKGSRLNNYTYLPMLSGNLS